MKIFSKQKFMKDGKLIKKYKFCGITLLRKEKSPTKKKWNLLGVKVSRRNIKERHVIHKIHLGKNKGVIYTCITGNYDNLIQHTYVDKNWDYICFTDNSEILKKKRIGQWKVEPLFFNELDNTRNARWHKTHPHILLKQYEYSIWLDGNINVTGNFLFDKAKECIKEHRILSVPKHPSRNCIYDEAIVVKAFGKDISEIIDNEIAKLRNLNYPKNAGLNETNIIFRYHNEKKCIDIMEDWFSWIKQFSRRDQLSFNYVLWKHNYEMKNFSDKKDVRHNPNNFIIKAAPNHSSIISTSSNLTTSIIIIPIYNAIDDVKTVLASIENSNLSEKVKIILVNDYSSELVSTFLRDFVKGKKRYTLLENEENYGFVKSCNRGIKIAKSDLIVLLNSDTKVPFDFEVKIQRCFDSDEKIGIASPLASSSGLWNLPFKDGMNYDEMASYISNNSDCLYPDILCPEGFCFCIRKKVIDNIGALDEIFGMGYCEETDLALRALNAGYRTVLIDDLYVYHKRHASFGLEKRNLQMKRNSSILWQRWKSLYDEKMDIVQMSKLKAYIHELIYQGNSKYKDYFNRNNKYKEKLQASLMNFDNMPECILDNRRKNTFNIFIPAINKNSMTAGPLGILYLGEFLFRSGFNVRFVLTERTDFDITAIRIDERLSNMADHVEFLYLNRVRKIEISENDICIATLWNSAYIANFVQSRCKNKKFIYMIQDYETIFYPNSSISALTDNTYNFDYNAIFSTKILQEYFKENKIGRFKNNDVNSIYFDTAASKILPEKNIFVNNRHDKKKFVFYGRPHQSRNMYELGLYIIQQAIEKHILDKNRWEFISVGAGKNEIQLASDVIIESLPYMDIETYKKKVSEMDLGLSLMLSPHPSMVPIDLALSGVVVVTNTYANKSEDTLKNISRNIFAGEPTLEGILSKLNEAVCLVEDLEKRYDNAKSSTYCNDYAKMFTNEHLEWIKNLYKM